MKKSLHLSLVTLTVLAIIGTRALPIQSAPDYTNVRFTVVRLGSVDDPFFYNADSDDAAVFKKAGVYWRGGVPFYVHGKKGVFKSKPQASPASGNTIEADLVTTSIPKAVGVFVLVATTGTQSRVLSSIGKIEYEFSDGTTYTGNVVAPDHYEILDEAAQQDLEIPENESEPLTRYTTVGGHLARYRLSVLFHAFPRRTLTRIRVMDTPDEGEGAETIDCPIWIYGITIATEP
ncbi:MAG: hypothetical protein ACPL7D_06790 [Candidatus Sumerlaeaceae bacterium]